MHIEFIHQNIYGVGGTVRSVINLANALSENHRVTITSVFRRVASPSLHIAPGVKVRPLIDLRPDGADRGDVRHNRVSKIVPPAEEYFRQYSELTDERITSHLRSSSADVIVGTRPSLNLLVAEFGRRGATLVAQEHMTHSAIPRTVVRRMRELYERLDLVTAVTEADRSRIVESLGLPDRRVRVLVNSIPTPSLPPSNVDTRLIYAVGRLAPEKRYDILLEAFAASGTAAPDWRLRIYGDGPSRSSLERKALRLGIRSQVDFMGATADMESEWPRASLLASTSERESFGMSIVEAMRNGVPVISTDCPDGPREIIDHNVNGVLVPLDDPEGVSRELIRLMCSHDERRAFGAAAKAASERYSPEAVAESFLTSLRQAGAQRSGRTLAKDAVGLMKTLLRPSRRGLHPQSSIALVAHPDSSLQVHGAPPGSFWKNAAGSRVRLDDSGWTSAGEFTSGIWNLHAPTSGAGSRRLRVTLIDAARLVASDALAASESRTGFSWTIPYRTYDGFAAVKAWNMARHAELATVNWSGDDLVIRVRLIGDWNCGPDITPVLSRSSAFSTPVALTPLASADQLEVQLNVSVLESLWLRKAEQFFLGFTTGASEAAPSPVASVLSDVPDLRRRRRFADREILDPAPFEIFHATPSRRLFVQPEFARDNVLTIKLSER